jgi:hypothetical protein
MYVCMYACMHACKYVRTYVCMLFSARLCLALDSIAVKKTSIEELLLLLPLQLLLLLV